MNTKLLQLKPFTGPKRYVFKDPDTGHHYEALDQAHLVKLIVGYRAQNGLKPLELLNLVLQHYWAGLPENEGNVTDAPKLHRGILAYIKGGVALLSNVYYGKDRTATQVEADARAAQCVACPYNIFPDKGPFLAWADMMAESCVGDLKSKHHDKLGNCEVCSCPLRAKVFYKGPIELSEEETEKMAAVNCWQVTKKG